MAASVTVAEALAAALLGRRRHGAVLINLAECCLCMLAEPRAKEAALDAGLVSSLMQRTGGGSDNDYTMQV